MSLHLDLRSSTIDEFLSIFTSLLLSAYCLLHFFLVFLRLSNPDVITYIFYNFSFIHCYYYWWIACLHPVYGNWVFVHHSNLWHLSQYPCKLKRRLWFSTHPISISVCMALILSQFWCVWKHPMSISLCMALILSQFYCVWHSSYLNIGVYGIHTISSSVYMTLILSQFRCVWHSSYLNLGVYCAISLNILIILLNFIFHVFLTYQARSWYFSNNRGEPNH